MTEKAGRKEPPMFTKGQLLAAKSLGLPRDVAAAVLNGASCYTADQAEKLVRTFLERKVK